MEVTGCFETHLTLEAPDLDQIRGFGSSHELKITHIILGNGRHPSQPMLTGRADGRLSDVLEKLQTTSALLSDLRVRVLRTKVETTTDNPAAPKDDHEAAHRPATWHFEHHVKLLLAPETDRSVIESIAKRHSARFSRNAFKDHEAGYQERFLTQRFFRTGRASASRSLDSLLKELSSHEIPVLESESEYVVHDSNSQLDADWIHHA